MNYITSGSIVNDSRLFPIIHDYFRFLFTGYGTYYPSHFTKKCCQVFGIKQDLFGIFWSHQK